MENVFDEYEMNFKYTSEHGECLCKKCLEKQIIRDPFKQPTIELLANESRYNDVGTMVFV